MSARASQLLRQLESVAHAYGPSTGALKVRLLRELHRVSLPTASEVLRLHETLCFLRAYPDDPLLLAAVELSLARFPRRRDLRRRRRALADTGIAGTDIRYPFFWFTARWLARRWPEQISIDWRSFAAASKAVERLHLLLPHAEMVALDSLDLPLREWVRRLKRPDETDAVFLVRRFERLAGDDWLRESLYEELDAPLRVAPGPDTPSRTRARHAGSPVVFQDRPLDRSRPALAREIRRPPLHVRNAPPREARALIDLAREAMATRSRDLDVFAHADEKDVRVADCGGGLQFVCFGAQPARRLVLEAVYGLLTLKNGVPIGYVLVSALFGSCEVAYNVFDTYRGAEAARVYGRVLGLAHHLFGASAFTIDPYQLGHENDEGLKSGAWWFYYKLGFRPHDPDVRRVLRVELQRLRANPRHRSDLPTLRKLVAANLYYGAGPRRDDVLGKIDLGDVGLWISRALGRRFGADREQGVEIFSREAARLLGLRSLARLSPGERLAWDRWSPLVFALPGVERWPTAERRALARVIRAKGGRRESDFVHLFDRRRRLRRAILTLAANPPPD